MEGMGGGFEEKGSEGIEEKGVESKEILVKKTCTSYKDVLVVFEAVVGTATQRRDAYSQIKIFYKNLIKDTGDGTCIRIKFVIADDDIVLVKGFKGPGDVGKIDRLSNKVLVKYEV